MGRKPKKEIEALYEMMMTPHFKSVMWSKSGRCIVIEYPGMFKSLTGPFFGFDRGLGEFKRFLIRHGFRRIGGSKYYNRLFRKGRKDLLGGIKECEVGGEWSEDVSEKEMEGMRERCREMMKEVVDLMARYRRNEDEVAKLRDVVFSLTRYMSTLRSYPSGKADAYDPSNRSWFGDGLRKREERHTRESRTAVFGFLDGLRDVRRSGGRRVRSRDRKKPRHDGVEEADIEVVGKNRYGDIPDFQ